MARSRTALFNPQLFLTKVGKGKTSLLPLKKQRLFSQGEAAEAVFYVQCGKVKLTVVSQQGKEAVVWILEQGALCGGILPGRSGNSDGDRDGRGRLQYRAN